MFVKFLHVNKMQDICLLIEQDVSDKKWIANSEFVFLTIN